jgi:hypothetical protein
MKTVRTLTFLTLISLLMASCSLFNKNKQGCGTDGRNVGAEKLLDGSAPKKSPKFRA